MQVYLVFFRNVNIENLEGIFSTKEKARAYITKNPEESQYMVIEEVVVQ